jgi:hypothetical protein
MAEIGSIDLINEHVAEIRYKPNSRVLDNRGKLAASISEHMSLSEWRIDKNRVDVFNKEESIRFFVSFNNAGSVLHNTTMPDYFPNQANKYFRHLFTLEPIPNPIPVIRLGVRSRFGIHSPFSFEDLLDRFTNNIISPSKTVPEIFNGNLIDIGAPMNFETDKGRVNSNSGPMKKEQLSKFFHFQDKDTLPEVALYIEFDYWFKPSEEMNHKDIISLVKNYALENWKRFEGIRSLVFEQKDDKSQA